MPRQTDEPANRTAPRPADPPAEPAFPPGRYGRRRAPRTRRPWVTALLLGCVVLAGLVVAVRMYQQYGDPAYQAKVITFDIDEARHRVTIEFQVYKPQGEAARCIVRARAANGEEVGRAEVDVPAGGPEAERVTVRYTLATSREPVTGEVVGCAPAGS